MRQHRSNGLIFPLLLSVLLPLAATLPALSVQADTSSLQSAFLAAANEFGVPVNILLAVSYNESRWDNHQGQPSVAGGYGVMHLTDVQSGVLPDNRGTGVERTRDFDSTDPNLRTLQTAATLLRVNPTVLKTDVNQNIRGGAALLAKYAEDTVGLKPETEGDWYGAVAKYCGSSEMAVALDYADLVFATIERGESRLTSSGQRVTLEPKRILPNKATVASLGLDSTPQPVDVECPKGLNCQFVPAAYVQYSNDPADYGNYDLANRPGDGLDIRYIVFHDTETPYEEAINIFQTRSYTSAHYVIRSSNGQIAQMVPTKDIAWHAGNWYVNMHSIGIEHEGYATEGAPWYNERLYHASARLVRYLAEKYSIPLDRAHILGHDNVPGLTPEHQTSMHWNPGPYWDWAHYMDLLGAPITPKGSGNNNSIVTINPNFETNQPVVSYCDSSGCRDLLKQPASFVYLYTAPDFSAPLIADPALWSPPQNGTTLANDWGDKAVTGQSFYLADEFEDWDAIYYGGQKAWFNNPRHNAATIPGGGVLVTPKSGRTSIPVYGAAFPEASAYPPSIPPCEHTMVPLQYSIPAGQKYVVADLATDLVTSDCYYAPTFTLNPCDHVLVTGQTKYYQIFFNHRQAFVNADDIDLVSGAGR